MVNECHTIPFIDKLDTAKILVSGPSRGGKSRWAEYLVLRIPDVVYVATAWDVQEDKQWIERIQIHRSRRPKSWHLIECMGDLSSTIIDNSDKTLLIDSLGGFVTSNLDLHDETWKHNCQILLEQIKAHNKLIVIVSEEVGWGIIPHDTIGIKFRDRLGILIQSLDEITTHSWLVTQGRALDIKQLGLKVP